MNLLVKRITKNFSSKAFKSFFFNYLLFIVISFLVCYFLYLFTYNRVSLYNERLYMSAFNHSRDIVLQDLSKAEELTGLLSNNQALNKVLLSDSSDPAAVRDLFTLLQSYGNQSFISDICVYNHKTDKAIWSSTSYDMIKMYGDFFAAGDMNYSTFYKHFLSESSYNNICPQTDFLLNGENKNCIVYYSSLPLLDNYNIKGNLMIFIDVNVLFEAIPQQFNADDIHIYLYNKGTMIAQTNNAPVLNDIPTQSKTSLELDGNQYMVFTSDSSNRHQIVICVPKSVLTQPLKGFTFTIFIILLCSTILYFLLAILLANLNLKPIRNIISQLDTAEIDSNINEYSLINNGVASLISSNRQFRDEYDKTRPIICSHFLQSLIEGQLTDIAVINATLSKVKPEFISKQYRLIIVSVLDNLPASSSNLERIAFSKEILTSYISEKLQFISCNTSATDVVAIVAIDFNEDDLIVIENIFNDISSQINKNMPMQFKIVLSDKFENLENTYLIYYNTLDTFNNGTYTSHNNIT